MGSIQEMKKVISSEETKSKPSPRSYSAYDDYLFSSSLLLTPPDSVQTESSPPSPASAGGRSSSQRYPLLNPFEDEGWTSYDSDSDSDASIEDSYMSETGSSSDCESFSDSGWENTRHPFVAFKPKICASKEDIELQGKDLAKIKEAIPPSFDNFLDSCLDYYISEIDFEINVRESLAFLRERLGSLVELEKKLKVENRQFHLKHKLTRQSRLSAGAVKSLAHFDSRYPQLTTDLVPKFPMGRIKYRQEMSYLQRHQFKSAIHHSYVKGKLNETAHQFDLLAKDAGVSEDELQRVRLANYSQAKMNALISGFKLTKSNLQPVKSILHRWYNEEGKVGAVAHCSVSLEDICSWKLRMDRQLKQITLEDIYQQVPCPIDWMHVSRIMTLDNGYPMEALDCERFWKNRFNPSIDNFSWTKEALEFLRDLVSELGFDWPEVAKRLGHGSDFLCFVMYRNYLHPQRKTNYEDYSWSGCEKGIVQNEINKGGDFATAANALMYYFPHEDYDYLAAQFCHASSFLNRKALHERVTPTEDAALFVTLEKMTDGFIYTSDFLINEVLPLDATLFWRRNEEWTHRLRHLFDGFPRPWSAQEDLKLLYLNNEFPGQWNIIATLFDGIIGSYRTPNNVLVRHGQLASALEQTDFIQFRNEYEIQKFNSEVYLPLRKAYNELQRLIEAGEVQTGTFEGFSGYYAPNDVDIEDYLLYGEGNLDYMKSAFSRLKRFFENSGHSIPEESTPMELPGLQPFQKDRRRFHREDPASVASALYTRRIIAKPLAQIKNPTRFELLVLQHMNTLSKSKLLKRVKNKYRNALPTTTELRSLPEISRILIKPIRPLEAVDEEDDPSHRALLGEEIDDGLKKVVVKCKATTLDEALQKISSFIQSSSDVDNNGCSQESPMDSQSNPCDQTSSVNKGIQSGIDFTKNKIQLQVPTLRETKGKKTSRVKAIRRMVALQRWVNVAAKKQLDDNRCSDSNADIPEVLPFMKEQEMDFKLSNPTPPSPNSIMGQCEEKMAKSPDLPLQEVKRNKILISPSSSPTTFESKRPKRNSRPPDRYNAGSTKDTTV